VNVDNIICNAVSTQYIMCLVVYIYSESQSCGYNTVWLHSYEDKLWSFVELQNVMQYVKSVQVHLSHHTLILLGLTIYSMILSILWQRSTVTS